MSKTSSGYVATDIQVLDGMSAIRKRPTMYIGDLEVAATNLVQEVLCKSLSGACRGEVNRIRVYLFGAGDNYRVRIEDDGPGWDTDYYPKPIHEKLGIEHRLRNPEVLLTQIFACRDEKMAEEKKLCTLGVVCTNALSSQFDFCTRYNAETWAMSFQKGVVFRPFEMMGPAEQSGTVISMSLIRIL